MRIGWMRSVNNIHQAFGVQSLIGELATATRGDLTLAELGVDKR